jgi:hypothetical protein
VDGEDPSIVEQTGELGKRDTKIEEEIADEEAVETFQYVTERHDTHVFSESKSCPPDCESELDGRHYLLSHGQLGILVMWKEGEGYGPR